MGVNVADPNGICKPSTYAQAGHSKTRCSAVP
jgi:hypothetical protein